MKNIYKESQVIIRTKRSHDSMVKHIQNVPGDKRMYGINEESALLSFPSFHPIDCLPPDIMHDVMEGIMPKLISCILHTIMSTRLSTAVQICRRINQFEYGKSNRKNRPPMLKENDIFDRRIPGKQRLPCLFLFCDDEMMTKGQTFVISFRQSHGEILFVYQLASNFDRSCGKNPILVLV